jgi:hypothetical protein
MRASRLLGWAIAVLSIFTYIIVAFIHGWEGWDVRVALVFLGLALVLPDLLRRNIPNAWRTRALIRLVYWSFIAVIGFTTSQAQNIVIGWVSLAMGGLSIPEIRDRTVPVRFRARSLAWMMWWTAVGVITLVSNMGGWAVPPQLILIIFLGIVLALVGTLLTEVLARRRFEKILSLESELQTSVTDLRTTQQEIEAKQRIAQLQEDIERYGKLADQAKSAASVALLVQEEFKKGERRSLWTGFAMNFVFFLLGVGASLITSAST